MKQRSALLQRQQKLQAATLTILHSDVSDFKELIQCHKEHMPEEAEGKAHYEGNIAHFRKELAKVRKAIAKMDELQKFVKGELKEAYFYENFGNTWEAMEPIGIEVLRQVAEDDVCDVPPEGWQCTRQKGHEGPCAAYPIGEEL